MAKCGQASDQHWNRFPSTASTCSNGTSNPWPHADAVAYGENGMLTLIVEHDPRRGYGSHALLMDDWKQIAAFFEMNRAVLGDRERLAAAIAGREPLSFSLHPYREMMGPRE